MTSDEYKQSVAEFFNLRQDYNKDDFHKRHADRLVAIARPQPGERVLDVATGTGLGELSGSDTGEPCFLPERRGLSRPAHGW